jgi:sugar/nucleoside kinase (ribokinase family)
MDDMSRFTGKTLSIEEAKNYLYPFQANVICLTCGAAGVWYTQKDSPWQHQNAQPVKIVDSTGAGDAFWAGFLTSRMSNLHWILVCNRVVLLHPEDWREKYNATVNLPYNSFVALFMYVTVINT